MENNKPYSDPLEIDSETREKKKTSKEKSLRELWEDLLSGKGQKASEKEKPETADVLKKAPKTDEETTTEETFGVVETIPLDEESEKSILLYPEENDIENESDDLSIETLGVIDHTLEENIDIPIDWDELESSKKSSPEELPSSATELSGVVESRKLTAADSQANEKKQPQSEQQPLVYSNQQFSYQELAEATKSTRPELTQVSVNPNETLLQNTEPESSSKPTSTSEVFADRLTQWRHGREIKKIKAKQRRHTKRLLRVKNLQRKNRQELSNYKSENDKTLKHLQQEITNQPAKSSGGRKPERATAPNKAARIDRQALPKEAQVIVEQLHLPVEHRLERSTWHTIEVDKKTGHAVEQPAAITYGSEFKHEQHQEAWNQDSEEVAVASGQLAVGTVTDFGLSALSPANDNLTSTNNGFKSTPSNNPLGINLRQSRFIATKAADPILWIILGVIIIAIIAAIKG